MQEKRPPLHLVLILFCLALLAYIAVSDLRHFRVPDHATIPLALGGLIWAFLYPNPWLHIGTAVVAAGVFLALGAGYKKIREVEGLGGGDVKLVAAGALWIGTDTALAVAIGAGVALAATFITVQMGRNTWDAPIPFGAYLAGGIGAVLILG